MALPAVQGPPALEAMLADRYPLPDPQMKIYLMALCFPFTGAWTARQKNAESDKLQFTKGWCVCCIPYCKAKKGDELRFLDCGSEFCDDESAHFVKEFEICERQVKVACGCMECFHFFCCPTAISKKSTEDERVLQSLHQQYRALGNFQRAPTPDPIPEEEI